MLKIIMVTSITQNLYKNFYPYVKIRRKRMRELKKNINEGTEMEKLAMYKLTQPGLDGLYNFTPPW